jgi:hypothetical protein
MTLHSVIPAPERQIFAENAYREGKRESKPSVIPAQAGIQKKNKKWQKN